MIEFSKYFDAESEISTWINDRRRKQDPKDVSFHLLGQEKDGTVIYCWEDNVPEMEEEGIVTHIGTFDITTRTNKLVFMHDKKVNVDSCTINMERTFIGFVTKENPSQDTASAPKPKDVYKAFIAEIQPQDRVFYLNIERSNKLQLQFLYPRQHPMLDRESHMLVFLHHESIGLYHIPMARMGDRGVILGGQPRKQQITNKNFAWCQFDQQNQRLHVIYHRKSQNATGTSQYDPVLASFQFTNQANIEVMVELPLEIPVTYGRSPRGATYLQLPLATGIPESGLNIEVLSQSNGTLCVCYQQRSSMEAENTADDMTELRYSVAMMHHGKTLHCSVPNIPRSIAKKCRIHFTMLGDYVMAYLPNHFVHLLNIGIELEPCHHILSTHLPTHPGYVQGKSRPPYLTQFTAERSKARKETGIYMYDNSSGCAWRVSVDKAAIVDMFQRAPTSTMRLALLHYAVVHNKDLPLIKQLFDIIAGDVTNSDIPLLLEEFLLGSTYTDMKARQVGCEALRLLPFTTAEIFRGQYEKDVQGARIGHVSYAPLKQAFVLLTKKLKFRTGDLWDNMSRRLHILQTDQLVRFSTRHVYREWCETQGETKVSSSPPDQPSFFKKLSSAAKVALFSGRQVKKDGRPPSRSEQILGSLPHFMEEKETDGKQEKIAALTRERLTQHLAHFLKKDSIEKIRNMSTEYFACQMSQSRLLCHLVWSIMGPTQDLEVSLCVTSTQSDYEFSTDGALFSGHYGNSLPISAWL